MSGPTRDQITWTLGPQTVLYNRATGRHVRLPSAALAHLDAGPLRSRLVAEGLWGAPLDPRALIVCRSRLPLLLPDAPALWAPVPQVHTAGGHGWRALPLTDDEVAAWRAINDARRVAQVAAHARVAESVVLALIARLTDPSVQAIQLRAAPPRPSDPSLERLVAPPRPANARSADQHGAHGETTLSAYHLDAITDGATHFDDRETTVAHVHAVPHPALRDRTYGEALHDALRAADAVPADGLVLEVGCGTGRMAADLAARLGERPYLRADLSPALLRTQAGNAPDTLGVCADGTVLPLRDASVGLLVSNEVLADLTAAPWRPGASGALADPIADRVARYAIPPLPGDGPYNLGAWRLIEEVARVLAPGGIAWLSEFGAPDGAPEEATQLDHPEVSIHFGHLLHVARGLGLDAHLVRLDDFLDVDRAARHLWRPHHHALRALARRDGRRFPARAWTEDTLAAALPAPVEGVRFVPVTEEGPGPLITRFHAIFIRRPVASDDAADAC